MGVGFEHTPPRRFARGCGGEKLDSLEKAESSSGKPRRLEFEVKLHGRYSDFTLLNNRYNIWQSQRRGLSLATTDPGGTWKQHDTLPNLDDRKLGQGQVFMVRFFLSS